MRLAGHDTHLSMFASSRNASGIYIFASETITAFVGLRYQVRNDTQRVPSHEKCFSPSRGFKRWFLSVEGPPRENPLNLCIFSTVLTFVLTPQHHRVNDDCVNDDCVNDDCP